MKRRYYGKPLPAKRDVKAALNFYSLGTCDDENESTIDRNRKRRIKKNNRDKARNKE